MDTEKKNALTVFSTEQEIPYIFGNNSEIKDLKKSIREGGLGQSLRLQIERVKLGLQDVASLHRTLSDSRKRWLTNPTEEGFKTIIRATLEIELRSKEVEVAEKELEALIKFLS